MFFLRILNKSQFRHLALRDTAAESSAWTSFAESFSWVALMLSYGRNSLNSEFRFRWTQRIHLSGFEVVITPHPMVVTLVVLWLSCDHIVTILWPYCDHMLLQIHSTSPTPLTTVTTVTSDHWHDHHAWAWRTLRTPGMGVVPLAMHQAMATCDSVVSGPCCCATSFMASSSPGHAASFLRNRWNKNQQTELLYVIILLQSYVTM